jgi:hypothetical protein
MSMPRPNQFQRQEGAKTKVLCFFLLTILFEYWGAVEQSSLDFETI